MNNATDVGFAVRNQRELGTPEQRLADLVSRQFSVRISASRMRSFVLAHWDELSMLGHAIKAKSRVAQQRALRRQEARP